ncbi:MAG: phosphoenolpyruvate carboxykinase (ATP) [Vicinamibacterales bacterium]
MAGGERKVGLEAVGIEGASHVYWNPSVAALYEEAVRRREAMIAADGPLVCRTGQHTGRSPNDKFIVKEAGSEQHVAWGKVNRPIDAESFDRIHRRMMAHLRGRDLFVQDCWAGADPDFRLPVRVVTERAWHSLFSHHLFIPETDPVKQAAHEPQFTVIDVPSFHANPAAEHTNSEVFILLNFLRVTGAIGGRTTRARSRSRFSPS